MTEYLTPFITGYSWRIMVEDLAELIRDDTCIIVMEGDEVICTVSRTNDGRIRYIPSDGTWDSYLTISKSRITSLIVNENMNIVVTLRTKESK